MVRTWPVVPREAEYAAIYSALVGQTDVGGIVVMGQAGVGKTTLARLVTQSLSCPVHWVVGTASARSIPLGVFADFVGAATPPDPMAFLAAAREAILAQGPCVIGVDDAHLLDPLSVTLVHRLAIGGSVRIVATVRSGEQVPDAITSLWKDGYLQRLYLTPFSKDECVGLIEQALGGRLEGLSADVMWQASGGNALFVRHLVEGAAEAGRLRQVHGVWQLRGRTAVTPELAAILDARIEQLPDELRHALELLSFCEPLGLDMLTRLVGEDAVEQAERRGLIGVAEEQLEVRFIHPLFGEVIGGRLGVAAARRLRGELVRVLLEQPIRGPAQRIQLAELMLDSDETPQTDLLVAAAQDALFLSDLPLGERLARAAVIQGGGLMASELLARALMWQGNAAEAEQTLRPFDPDAMTEEELLRWGAARIATLHWLMGDTAGVREVLKLLRDRVTHPAGRLFVDGVATMTTMSEGRLEEAVKLCERVLADPAACPQAIERALSGGTIALALMGRLDRVAELAARGDDVKHHMTNLRRHLWAFGEIWGLVFAGDFDTAEKRSADVFRVSSPGQYLAWGMVNVLASTVEVARGRFSDAVSRMEQTVAALTSESTAPWIFLARLLLAQSYCALGQVEPAATMVAELRSRFGRHLAVFEPQLRLTEAWLAAARGHVSAAIELALDAGDIAQRSGQRAIELRARHDALRFGDRTALQRIIDIAPDVGGRLAPIYGAHAAALAHRDPAAVYSAAEQFERIGALLSAADAAAQATVLFDAAGDRRTAKAAAAAERLAAACGGIMTPALILAAQPLPLTTREREIANFAAQGLSNREIADRLVVSARTVEAHIYRACIKLGLSDRKGLATMVRNGQAQLV